MLFLCPIVASRAQDYDINGERLLVHLVLLHKGYLPMVEMFIPINGEQQHSEKILRPRGTPPPQTLPAPSRTQLYRLSSNKTGAQLPGVHKYFLVNISNLVAYKIAQLQHVC